jgi:hypothetical protein
LPVRSPPLPASAKYHLPQMDQYQCHSGLRVHVPVVHQIGTQQLAVADLEKGLRRCSFRSIGRLKQ